MAFIHGYFVISLLEISLVVLEKIGKVSGQMDERQKKLLELKTVKVFSCHVVNFLFTWWMYM